MNNKVHDHLQTTLRILLSDTDGLRMLASYSGFDVFSFYEGADLRGVDLAGQDLQGLSFSDADLRGANLGGISYDLGAFNNSILSDRYSALRDEFDGYLEDALREPLKRVYIFARFRPVSFEETRLLLGLSYSDLARLSDLSHATVRKASKGLVVNLTTATSLAEAFRQVLSTKKEEPENMSLLRQPMLEFLADEVKGGWSHISQEELIRITALSQRVTELRSRRGSRNVGDNYLWRERPRVLEWLETFYSGGGAREAAKTLFD
jgi:transcriptional regulator with XRE-family HTH domain